MESKIFSHLSTSTNITVTSSVSTRIYPEVCPQQTDLPVIVYARVSSNPEYSLDGYSSLENSRIQIDTFAETYKEAKVVAGRVKVAMDAATAYKAIMTNDMDEYDPELQVFRVIQDYSCWNRE